MLTILGPDKWGVDWSGWAAIRKHGRPELRFPIDKYIVWC